MQNPRNNILVLFLITTLFSCVAFWNWFISPVPSPWQYFIVPIGAISLIILFSTLVTLLLKVSGLSEKLHNQHDYKTSLIDAHKGKIAILEVNSKTPVMLVDYIDEASLLNAKQELNELQNRHPESKFSLHVNGKEKS